MQPQNQNDILSAINSLSTSVGNTPVPTQAVPALNFNAPSAGALDSKYQEFLTRASQDPDIVAYYKQLLDYAQGDVNLAKQQIENDYQTGVRQTTDTLKGSLKSLGLTFDTEQKSLQDTLNKRGIALTDMGGSKTAYAQGGQPATELGNLNQSQGLRQEAEQRTASQNIEKMGITRSKALTTAGQGLRDTALNLKQQQSQDIYGRANVNYGAYQSQQAANANKALMTQGGGTSGGYGDPQNMTQDQRQALFTQYGHAGIAPVGYGGG